MKTRLRTPLGGLAFAVVVVVLATLLTMGLRSLLITTPFALYFGAVTVVAYLSGRVPGFAAALLSVFCINFFFVPHMSRGIVHPSDVVSMVCFFGTTLFASYAADRQRSMMGALADVEGQLRQVVENMDEMFLSLDKDWNFLHVNQSFERFNNCRREDLIGRSIWELFPNARGTIYETKYREVLETGHEITIENQSKETGKWFRLHIVPNGDGVSVFVAEITQAKQFELRRRELEQRFELMADSAPVLIWIGGLDREHSWFNRRWLDFTGHTLDEERNSGWMRSVHPDDLKRCIETYGRHFQSRQPFVMDFRMLRADGEYRWVQGAGVPLYDGANDFQGYIGSCVDVTDRKELEQERVVLLEAEREARAQAERVSQMKDEFLATLSHELRTPLNAILGWAQLMRGDAGNSVEVEQALGVIERNARLQVRLVEDLLDMSRIVSGNMRLERTPTLLEPVIQAALDSVRPMGESRNVGVEFRSSHKSRVLLADSARMQQVVWNLLTNAIKFSPPGGEVLITLEEEEYECRIVVQDEGQGISSEFLPYVFDRFRQQDGSTTRRHGGLGLGLGLVRHLVELHGGQVYATSPGEGQGATFHVILPLSPRAETTPTGANGGLPVEAPNEDASVEAAVPLAGSAKPATLGQTATVTVRQSPGSHCFALDSLDSDGRGIGYGEELAGAPALENLQGKSILLIDDDADSLQLAVQVMELSGARASCVDGVAAALEKLGTERFDLLVSDIGMPGEDGCVLIERVRSSRDPVLRDTPALALTALAGAGDRQRILEAGFDCHMAKPFSPEEFVRAVAQLVADKRRRNAGNSG